MNIKKIDVTLKSGDKEISIGKGKPYRLLLIEGLESANIELNAISNVAGDGYRVRNRKIGYRNIIIEAEYTGLSKETARREVAGFFNVHKDGLLELNYMGVERQISYVIESYKASMKNLYNPFSFLISLYCPDPFLLDITESGKEVTAWLGGLKFPLRLPSKFATEGEKLVNIFNGGDTETPIKIELIGKATNPKILNRTSGEFMRIKKVLNSDDSLIITTGFGNKRVELNGVNALNILDLPSSKFINLLVGDNVLELTTEDSSDTPSMLITYKNKYLGV